MLAALVASGLDASRFTFFGFLTRSGSERRDALDEIATLRHTAVLYEAPNRVADTLADIEKRGGGARPAAVAREMTKQFEEVQRGTVSELRAYYESRPPRGELVLVIGAAVQAVATDDAVRERVRALRAAGMSARDASTAVAEELGVPRRLAYRFAQDTGVDEGGSDA
jgi:16S rRNA (cytidine1402-2'-O)-methyltransferase